MGEKINIRKKQEITQETRKIESSEEKQTKFRMFLNADKLQNPHSSRWK